MTPPPLDLPRPAGYNPVMDAKECSRCAVLTPFSGFRKAWCRSTDGLESVCRACRAVRRRLGPLGRRKDDFLAQEGIKPCPRCKTRQKLPNHACNPPKTCTNGQKVVTKRLDFVETKPCKRCGCDEPLGNYHKLGPKCTSPDGREAVCKACRNHLRSRARDADRHGVPVCIYCKGARKSPCDCF